MVGQAEVIVATEADDGAIIQPKGGDNGGQGTAVGQQGDDQSNDRCGGLQAIVGGALRGGKRVATGGTAAAPLLATVDDNISLGELSVIV